MSWKRPIRSIQSNPCSYTDTPTIPPYAWERCPNTPRPWRSFLKILSFLFHSTSESLDLSRAWLRGRGALTLHALFSPLPKPRQFHDTQIYFSLAKAALLRQKKAFPRRLKRKNKDKQREGLNCQTGALLVISINIRRLRTLEGLLKAGTRAGLCLRTDTLVFKEGVDWLLQAKGNSSKLPLQESKDIKVDISPRQRELAGKNSQLPLEHRWKMLREGEDKATLL